MASRRIADSAARNTCDQNVQKSDRMPDSLSDLMEHPVPSGPRKEMHKRRTEASGRLHQTAFLIVLAPAFVRPIDDEGFPLDVLAREEPPVPAVLRVVAVVAHDEVLIGRYSDGTVPLAHVERRDLAEFRRR